MLTEVLAICRSRGEALLSSDEIITITMWIDEDGECDPWEAIARVAGPCRDGKWYSVDLTEFEQTWRQ